MNNYMKFEIKPCPFCGSDETQVDSTIDYRVECKRCEAQGPKSKSFNEAIGTWNNRMKKNE